MSTNLAALRIDAEWFGADRTGTNDSTAALQSALDSVIALNVVLGAVRVTRRGAP